MKDLKDNLKDIITLNEAVSSSQYGNAIRLIQSYLHKKGIGVWSNPIEKLTVGGAKYVGVFAFSAKNSNGSLILFKNDGASNQLDAIGFTSQAATFINNYIFGGTTKFDIEVECNNASISGCLPFIADVINGNEKMDEKSIRNFFKTKYMYEGLEAEFADILNEDELSELIKKRDNLSQRKSYNKANGKPTDEIEKELAAVKEQIKIKKGIAVTTPRDKSIDAAETALEDRATPQERFKDMEHYINMILKGLKPSLVLCGAPGVGKTFRVMRKIKASGHPYKVIKGKETPTQFFCDLFLYRHEGDILICDDADDVLTDETITNLIKAATDSSDERIVTYGTTRPPIMPEELFMSLTPDDQELCGIEQHGKPIYFYPKYFETHGSLIIITNYPAGKVDTAVRNRALICDLAFTTEELLGLVEEIADNIMPDKLSKESKSKALSYLHKLVEEGSAMDISIRSFCTCAIVYEGIDEVDGVSESDVERMIKEQMKLAAARGGKKY